MDGEAVQHLWFEPISDAGEYPAGQVGGEVTDSLQEMAYAAVRDMDEVRALLEMLSFCLSCYLGDLHGVQQKVMERRSVLFQQLNMGSLALRASDFAQLGLCDGFVTCQCVVEYLEAQEMMILRRLAHENTIP